MKDWVDPFLNKVSMYRLLSVALGTLFAVAVLLSILGELPYSALAMSVSALVLVLAAYLSNLLFGRLFGVRTHDESSFITAMIMFFIFSPTVQPGELAALGLAAVIAMATKYLLVIRGRHIFNPAAIAAVIVGVIGVAHTAWWVATPVLLPTTALFTLLILYKTRRLKLGALFFLIASVLIVTLAVLDGQSLPSAAIALLSWPLLFFAGFMLSEPLTLPPRHWQQYTEGVIVAVLFAAPIHVGIISGSPALALVIGNAVAFMFARRQHIRLTFRERKKLGPMTDEYVFEAKMPVNFMPGQYMEITVPHSGKDGRGIRRIFSIVGTPDETTVRFGIKMYDRPSSFKHALKSLKKGTIIDATGIGGDFILPADTNTPLLFVAGGIGITPFISHLLYLRQQSQSRDIILLYSVNDVSDLCYVDELQEAKIDVVVINKTNEQLPSAAWIHHNKQRLSSSDLEKIVPDIARRHAYVSGPPAMVDATKRILKQSGATRIKSDYFTGY